jgi:hypothetical protein
MKPCGTSHPIRFGCGTAAPRYTCCESVLNERMRGLKLKRLEFDEIWTFVQKKQKRVRPTDPAEFGDQFVFVALDPESKRQTRNFLFCLDRGSNQNQTKPKGWESWLRGSISEPWASLPPATPTIKIRCVLCYT